MTKNQQKLLHFLGAYRLQYGKAPTLREMVTGIGVSDNKSILGIIENLVNRGYLIKDAKKSRSIFLTDEALKLIGINLLPMSYRKGSDVSDSRLRMPSSFPVNDVTVTMPTADSISYSGKSVKNNGTSLEDIKSVVETVVNIALSHYTNGTILTGGERTGFSSKIASLCVRLFGATDFLERLSWATLLMIFSTFCFFSLGKNATAIVTAIVFTGVIFVIHHLTKKI